MIETIFRKIPVLREGYRIALKTFFRVLPHDGVSIMDEEWDYLIVLDACRFDYFEEQNHLEGKLSKKISQGSTTIEWVQKNFTKPRLDTVYVSANPYISRLMLKRKLGFVPFFYIDEVWDYGWDDEMKTILPEKVTDAAIRDKEKFADKRLIIHYNQPHQPAISDPGLIKKDWHRFRQRVIYEGVKSVKKDLDAQNVWNFVVRGEISIDRIKKGYVENLSIVLKEVEKLLEELEGRIIVTADHGECFGEYWLYAHPGKIYIKPLVEVPWLVIEK